MRPLHPSAPNCDVHVDFVGPLRADRQGNEYVLSMHDGFLKFNVLVPTALADAEAATRALMEHWVATFGTFPRLRSDRGRHFVNQVMAEMQAWLHTRAARTWAYHPQGNGSLERMHATLVRILRKLVQREPERWGEYIKVVQLALNTTYHSGIGMTPFRAMFGREARIVFDDVQADKTHATVRDYARHSAHVLARTWADVRHALNKQHERTAVAAGEKGHPSQVVTRFGPGDLVLRTRRKRGKLDSVMRGVFVIVKPVGMRGETYLVRRRDGQTLFTVGRRDLRRYVPERVTGEGTDQRGPHGSCCVTCGGGGELRRCATCSNVFCQRHWPASATVGRWRCGECAPDDDDASDTGDEDEDQPQADEETAEAEPAESRSALVIMWK